MTGNIPDPAVAVVGLGQMGAGIARNLDRAGLLRAAFDLRPGAFAAAGLSDTVVQAPVADLLQQADILLFAVPTTDAIAQALHGLNLGATPGRVIIDLTTSGPDQSRAMAEKLDAAGLAALDAAMTGGAVGADAGRLTLMVGGEASTLARCTPAFNAIADHVFHLGPSGSGHAMKLVHNMILHGHFLATCEGLQMAKRAGLDLAAAVDVLNAGNARSFVTETRFPRDILSGTMNARSQVANLEKDLGLAVDIARQLGSDAPFGTLTHDMLARAITAGMADQDFSHLFDAYPALARLKDQKE